MHCADMETRRGGTEGRRYLDPLDAGLHPELLHGSASVGDAVGAGRLRRHPRQRDTVEVKREEHR